MLGCVRQVLWTKGIDILLALMHHALNNNSDADSVHTDSDTDGNNSDGAPLPNDAPFPIVIYGNGPDLDEVKKANEWRKWAQ